MNQPIQIFQSQGALYFTTNLTNLLQILLYLDGNFMLQVFSAAMVNSIKTIEIYNTIIQYVNIMKTCGAYYFR